MAIISLIINPYLFKKQYLYNKKIVIYVDDSISMFSKEKQIQNYLKTIKKQFKDQVTIYLFSSQITPFKKNQIYKANQPISFFSPILKHINYLPLKTSALIISDFCFSDLFTPIKKSNVYYINTSRESFNDKAIFILKDSSDFFYQKDFTNKIEILLLKNTPSKTKVSLKIDLKNNNQILLSKKKTLILKKQITTIPYSFSKINSKNLLLSVKLINNQDHKSYNDHDQFLFKNTQNNLQIISWIFKATPDIQKIHQALRTYQTINLTPQYFLNPKQNIKNAKNFFLKNTHQKHQIHFLFSPPKEVITLFQKSDSLFFLIPQNISLKNNLSNSKVVKLNENKIFFNLETTKPFFNFLLADQRPTDLFTEIKSFKTIQALKILEKDIVYATNQNNFSSFFKRNNMIFIGFYPISYLQNSNLSTINFLENFLYRLIFSIYEEHYQKNKTALRRNYFLGEKDVPQKILNSLKVKKNGSSTFQIPPDKKYLGTHTIEDRFNDSLSINIRLPYKEYFLFKPHKSFKNELSFEETTQIIKTALKKTKNEKQLTKIVLDKTYFIYFIIFLGFVLFSFFKKKYENNV